MYPTDVWNLSNVFQILNFREIELHFLWLMWDVKLSSYSIKHIRWHRDAVYQMKESWLRKIQLQFQQMNHIEV